jgi:hypothetical protein
MERKGLFDILYKMAPDVGGFSAATQALCGAGVLVACIIVGAGAAMVFRSDMRLEMNEIIKGCLELEKFIIVALAGSLSAGRQVPPRIDSAGNKKNRQVAP